MVFLSVINLVFAGLLAGAEVACHYGFVIQASFLSEADQVRLRQALARRLRVLMPALFLPTFVTTMVITPMSVSMFAAALRVAAFAGTLVWAYARIFRTISVNRASVTWDPDTPPEGWKAHLARAERYHLLSLWAVTIGFVCLATAKGASVSAHVKHISIFLSIAKLSISEPGATKGLRFLSTSETNMEPPTGSGDRLDMRLMVPLFAILAIDMMGAGVILPLLPFYAQHFGAGAFAVGLLVAAFSFCQFISTPILGRWSDRYGRRALLAISQLGTLGSLLLLAIAPSLTIVFIARILGGLTAGNMSVASALAVDHSSGVNRKQAIGIVSAGVGLGLMAGPALSALFAGVSLSAPIWVAAGLSALSAASTLLLLPKDRANAAIAARKANAQGLKIRGVAPVLAVLGAFYLAFSMYTSELAVVAHSRSTWNGHVLGPQEIGWLFTLTGAINIVVQLFAMRRVSSILSDRAILIGSLMAMTASFAALGIATTLPILISAVAVTALASSFFRPVLISTLTLVGPPGSQGSLMGINSSIMAGANILGPVIAGALVAHAHFILWALVMSTLCAAGIVMVITAASTYHVTQPG